MRKCRTFQDFTVEYQVNGVTVYLVISGYRFPDHGRISGRPEDSYPPESSEWEIKNAYIRVRDFDEERETYKGGFAKHEVDYIYKDVELPEEFISQLVYANEDELWELIDIAAADYDDALRQNYYDSITERDR